MLTWVPISLMARIRSLLVKWQPWSVWKISGSLPAVATASLIASRQNDVPTVLESLASASRVKL